MPSLTFSPVLYCNAVSACICSTLLGRPSSACYILTRLFRRGPLPRLFGSDSFTRRTLRFAWHLTSVAWLGFAALLVQLAGDSPPGREQVLGVVATTFLLTAVITATASRGRHFAWPVFLAIAALAWLAL